MAKVAQGLSRRNKWSYSIGCIGRDMAYVLVSLYILTYIQYTMNITTEMFSVISIFLVLCSVWDAVNDPMMGTIITNTKSKQGKYRPWIIIGAVTNVITIIALFVFPAAFNITGWTFVIFFGITYLLWETTFTMNDISYWSLLPALAHTKKDRDSLTTLVATFASLGSFLSAILVTFLTPGNAIEMYKWLAIGISAAFVLSQVMVFFLVKDNSDEEEIEESVTVKQMFKIIFSNKQLLVMAVVVFLYSLGSSILNAFGTNYFYIEFGYNGNLITLFLAMYAVGTLSSQAIYPLLAKKFKRGQLVAFSVIMLVIGYVLFFVIGVLPFGTEGAMPIKFIIIAIVSLFIFAGQGVFYLAMLVMLANTIEYGEWQSGRRQEAISFAVRPFMVKLSSAVERLMLTITLSLTGLWAITNGISEIEVAFNYFQNNGVAISPEFIGVTSSAVVQQMATELLNANVTPTMRVIYLFSMTIVPVIMYVSCYFILKKKYIITEEKYEEITAEINARSEAK